MDKTQRDPGADEFLEHYGVPGMHWGHRKTDAGSPGTGEGPLKGFSGTSRSVARKGVAVVRQHPRTTIAAALLARAAYRHRGEIVGTAILAGRAGKYVFTKGFEHEHEVATAVALGRQVVQGFVVG